jgi:hypothetical protein
MRAESVKGSLIVGAAVAVRHLRDRGLISADALEARLSKESVELIDAKIAIAGWYPVHAFNELLDVDWEISGDRKPAYLEQLGAKTSAKMFDSQRYQQLEYAERIRTAESRESLIRQARLITTITGTLFNFLEVDVGIESGHLHLTYRNARTLDGPILHTTVGFMNEINARQGNPRSWTSERLGPDTLRFKVALPKHLIDGT